MSRRHSSFCSLSFSSRRCCNTARWAISLRAHRSADYRASDKSMKLLKLMVSSRSSLPSETSLLLRGTAYPFLFFQFDTGGGIFHSSCCSAFSTRGGDRKIEAGGDGALPGMRLILNFGGSHGSTCRFFIFQGLRIWSRKLNYFRVRLVSLREKTLERRL